MQVFGEGGSEEQAKGQCTELLKLKIVENRLRFLDASPKTSKNQGMSPRFIEGQCDDCAINICPLLTFGR